MNKISLIIYLLPLFYIVYKTRWVKSMESFAVADRKMSTALLFASISATFIGPGYSLGFIGQGYHWGFLYLMFGAAYAVQTILVGIYIAPRLRETSSRSGNDKSIVTLGGFFKAKTGKTYIQCIIGSICLLVCIGFSAVMLHAGGTLIHTVWKWNMTFGMGIIALVTAIYTMSGGLKASIYTDVFQFVFFVGLISLAVLLILFEMDTDISFDFSTTASILWEKGMNTYSIWEILSLLFMFFLGETLIPPYATRTFSSKTPSVAKKAFIFSGIFSFFWFGFMLLIGIFAYMFLGAQELEGDIVLFSLVEYSHPFIQNLVGLSIFCIVMSSLDSLFNAAAIIACNDLYIPEAGEEKKLQISRIAVLVIMVIAFISALSINSIVGGLLQVYSFWAPSVLPSLFYVIWVRSPKFQAVVVAIIVGFLTVLYAFLFAMKDYKDMLLIAGFIMGILSLFIMHNIKYKK